MTEQDRKSPLGKVETMEMIISNYLRIGVGISAVMIMAGLLKLFITGQGGQGGYPPEHYPHSIQGIFRGLLLAKADAIILAGLFLLVLTPIFRVGVSVILFLKEKDYLYVVITSLVFIILLLGFWLGKSFD
jgi:uncharacterized membrane protein